MSTLAMHCGHCWSTPCVCPRADYPQLSKWGLERMSVAELESLRRDIDEVIQKKQQTVRYTKNTIITQQLPIMNVVGSTGTEPIITPGHDNA